MSNYCEYWYTGCRARVAQEQKKLSYESKLGARSKNHSGMEWPKEVFPRFQ